MSKPAEIVLAEIQSGVTNLKTLFRRNKKVGHKLWDGIRELKNDRKISYDCVSGTLALI